MRLIYDNIVFAIQKFGGISVVWKELLERMQNTHELPLKYIDVDNDKVSNYSRSKLDIKPSDVLSTIKYKNIERYMPVHIESDEPFLFHSSYYRYCKNPKALNITTVHDFTYEFFVNGLKQKIHTWQKFSAIRHSAAVVCISENTKRDLLHLMPDVDEAKVKVIYNGVSESFHKINGSPDHTELPFKKYSYVVFIGRRDSYKNFDLVLKSVSATSLNLLIIGRQLNEQEKKEVAFLLPPTRYKCISNITDEYLNLLYNYAAALVYPSSYEGFGLPVLEAQCAGCPVIALKASSIPEIIGKTPLLMHELTDKEMIDKLTLLENKELMNDVRSEGFINSKRFGWEAMSDEYAALYKEVYFKAQSSR